MKNTKNPPLIRCADCGFPREQKACATPPGKSPDFCPMQNHKELISESQNLYLEPAIREFSRQASIQEGEGYADRQAKPFVKKPCKTRVEEIWEFAHRMGYKKVGLAFCLGLVSEAKITAKLLSCHGLEVVSVICKVGAVPKEFLGLSDEEKICSGRHESMCNPLLQAGFLNHACTEFNILLGLCVGHDSLFFKHSQAPCTVLAVKDRVTGHNPLATIYSLDSYYVRLK